MKALKTIVATAVIVFALTTVAMAGVQRIGSQADTATTATSPTATQTHQAAGLTLTDDQFARLMYAANGQATKLHAKQADRETTRERVRDHSGQKASDSAVHAQAQQRTQSHNASGGTHHDGGTHDTGTHHGGGTCNE